MYQYKFEWPLSQSRIKETFVYVTRLLTFRLLVEICKDSNVLSQGRYVTWLNG